MMEQETLQSSGIFFSVFLFVTSGIFLWLSRVFVIISPFVSAFLSCFLVDESQQFGIFVASFLLLFCESV